MARRKETEKDCRISFRMTKEERARLDRQTEQSGLSISELVRSALNGVEIRQRQGAEIADRLCREHGLSVIVTGEPTEQSHAVSYAEWLRQSRGQSTVRLQIPRVQVGIYCKRPRKMSRGNAPGNTPSPNCWSVANAEARTRG